MLPDLAGAQFSLGLHPPQVGGRTEVASQGIYGCLLGGMSYVEEAILNEPAILLAVADTHDPGFSCQSQHRLPVQNFSAVSCCDPGALSRLGAGFIVIRAVNNSDAVRIQHSSRILSK